MISLSSLAISGCGSDVGSNEAWDLREDINECIIDVGGLEGEGETLYEDLTSFRDFFIWIEPKRLIEDIPQCGCTIDNITGLVSPSDSRISSMDIYYSESGTLVSGESFFDQYLLRGADLSYSINSIEEGVSVDRMELIFSLNSGSREDVVLNNEFTINLSNNGNGCGFLNSSGEIVDSFSIKRDYVFRLVD